MAVVSHVSALSVHELGDVDPAKIHLTVPINYRRRQPPAVVLHRQDVPETDVQDRGGYKVTTPARAIAESADALMEQGWLNGAVEEALFRGLVTPRLLRDTAARLGPRAEVGVERALGAVAR
jgi:hypothetical protein